jgi:hypothetical protein
VDSSAAGGREARRLSREGHVGLIAIKQQRDPDVHKGAIEGDTPLDEQFGNPNGDGVDEEGMPDDPVASAEDELGANEDGSQG